MRRNLIVVRAGDGSLHPQWLPAGPERNFDLFVSYYGEHAGAFAEQADGYETHPGMKWPRIWQLFEQRRDWLLGYDAVWFPDDDLATDGRGIDALFELFHRHGLGLAQPALGPGSHVSHRITQCVPGLALRFTSFVEVMCPIFARDTLRELAGTFRESVSGWGLDFVWPHLLGYPRDRIAILDATPVVHTRPHGSGPSYRRLAAQGINPRRECEQVLRKFRVRRRALDVYSALPSAPG